MGEFLACHGVWVFASIAQGCLLVSYQMGISGFHSSFLSVFDDKSWWIIRSGLGVYVCNLRQLVK